MAYGITWLKFGHFGCNGCLVDTCAGSRGSGRHKTEEKNTAWYLCLWNWEAQDVLVAEQLALPALSVTFRFFGGHWLSLQSGSGFSGTVKPPDSWPSVPVCGHTDTHTRRTLYTFKVQKVTHALSFWIFICSFFWRPLAKLSLQWIVSVIKEKSRSKLENRGVADYSTRSPLLPLFIFFSGWLHPFHHDEWKPNSVVISLSSYGHFIISRGLKKCREKGGKKKKKKKEEPLQSHTRPRGRTSHRANTLPRIELMHNKHWILILDEGQAKQWTHFLPHVYVRFAFQRRGPSYLSHPS